VKAKTVEEEMATARQDHGKHTSVAMNNHAIIQELLEAVLSLQSY
jgi:hypothetical protein